MLFELARIARLSGSEGSFLRAVSAARESSTIVVVATPSGLLLIALLPNGRITRWVPWTGPPPTSMALSETGEWLLCLASDGGLAVVPVLAVLAPDERLSAPLWPTTRTTTLGQHAAPFSD